MSPQLNDGNIRKGLRSLRDLTQHLTTRELVRPATSGATNSRGVTGGVYKTRERIHRNIADLRLLAIPTSCTRVAEYNPN